MQTLRTATLLKRDVEPQVFPREFSELFKSTYFVEDLWTAGSETPVLLYKNIFLKRISPVAFSDSFMFQPATLFFKRDSGKIFKNIFPQNTSGWLHLWTLRSFPDHFFYRTPLGNCLFHAQVAGFQPQDTIRIFHKCFSSILYKNKK